MDNAEYIWKWLWERVGNDFGVAGLMGNLCAESGLKPDNLQNSYEKLLGMTDREYTDAVDSGRYEEETFIHDSAGYGLAQWTYPSRKQGLYDFAKLKNKSVGDLDMQLEFLWTEIGSNYRSVLMTLVNAESVREASDAVMLQYERPADQSEENRESRADLGRMYYDRYATQEQKLTIYRRLFYDSDCYKQGTEQVPTGVQVHSTGANNPWLRRYVQPDDGRLGKNPNGNDHNHPGGNVCANAYIGKQADGTVAVYQALPWEYRCWLSGSGSNGNANRMGYIGYEICEDGLTDRTYFDAVMDKAVLLTAYLCNAYSIDPENVRDHHELHGMGLASNHGDITHWLGKFGQTMDGFRARVREAMAQPIRVEYVDCDDVRVLYQAVVDNPDRWLNVRSGPGKTYKVVFQVEKGSIVNVLNDSNKDWWNIQQDGKTGYAMSEYLKKVQNEPDDEPDDEPPALQETVEIPLELALRMYRVLGEQLGLTVDARSGNVSNIDYQ